MPLVFHRTLPNETQIGIWKVEESIDELRKRLILNEEELAFFNTLQKNKRNLHWLSSRVLLRKLLNTPEFIQLEGDKFGKPHLINFDYELSISHSFEYAAVIISKNRVGIDIELIKPKISLVADKFMSEEEMDGLGPERIKELYVYWGGKESLYKLYGKGDIRFRENMFLYPFNYQTPGIAKARFRKDRDEEDYNIHYREFDDYMLTYVIEGFPGE